VPPIQGIPAVPLQLKGAGAGGWQQIVQQNLLAQNKLGTRPAEIVGLDQQTFCSTPPWRYALWAGLGWRNRKRFTGLTTHGLTVST